LKRALVAAFILLASAAASAQQAETARPAAAPASNGQISFHFDRPGLAVPKFTITVNEDGSGRYEADQIFPVQPGSDAPQTQHIDRKVTLSLSTTAHIFATARDLNRFNLTCASAAKNIADTGTKSLQYTGEGGDGSCVYNYSQDKRVVALTDLFQAIAMTLDIGRKLDFDHRFDRLGLDATMATLVEEVDAGRATELGTISATLKSIAQDSELLERVRLRAAKLLRQARPSA
jgi:hypothetical protein